ncbi:MAG: hypothetical protein AAFX87_04900 [Bacteroidota bacterium]
MSNHDIRLRRRMMTSRRIERHKNYSELMRKHKRSNSRRLLRIVSYLAFIVGMMVIIYYAFENL